MNSTFSGLLKRATDKASDVLQNLGIGDALKFPGKEGDVIYSKNNVCIHPPSDVDDRKHVPGYLSVHCQKDEVLGITLILQWLPNATLERNPQSYQTVSPRTTPGASANASPLPGSRVKLRHLTEQPRKTPSRRSSSEDSDSDPPLEHMDSQSITSPTSEGEDATAVPCISVEMSGDNLRVVADGGPNTAATRPLTLDTEAAPDLGIPTINVVPHTPVRPTASTSLDRESPATSGADEDEASDPETRSRTSSPYSSDGERAETPVQEEQACISALLLSFCRGEDYLEGSPEAFAQKHNLMLPDGVGTEDGESQLVMASPTDSQEVPTPDHPSPERSGACLFSVDLGKMRSLRLFYSNPECTCGQLVLASHESRYKILHFHHGGLDKLGQIFGQWSVLRAKSRKGESPAEHNLRQFAICRPSVPRPEQHPEENIYDRVTWDFWRSCCNPDGAIEDDLTLRKAIFFGGVEESLRKEAWPFLLHVYPWNSTREQRDAIRNDLFLEYQNVRKKRLKLAYKSEGKSWQSVESTVGKDVVRTDRLNPYYSGDDNPNIEVMRNILLNYAAFCPQLGYIQGMSDLLAPILATVQNESDVFWCFAGLMQRTIFVSAPSKHDNNNMDRNLELLRELLRVMYPEFLEHLENLGQSRSDILQLLFTHRWILLCFKREFPEAMALKVWEACWACWQSDYFHLFVCLAIITSYGGDCLDQKLAHDEILLYFSSLAGHMDGNVVLQKARGLLHQFLRREKIPCTLSDLCDLHRGRSGTDLWEGGHEPVVECVQQHPEGESCLVSV